MANSRFAILATDNVTVEQLIIGDAVFCAAAFPGRICINAPYEQFFVGVGFTWDAGSQTFAPPADPGP